MRKRKRKRKKKKKKNKIPEARGKAIGKELAQIISLLRRLFMKSTRK
jgi:hypothetical protein